MRRESRSGEPLAIDLSPLDPTRDGRELERFVRGICGAAAAELVHRRSSVCLGDMIVRWRRPILAAGAVLALASAAAILTSPRSAIEHELAWEESLGVPRAWVNWVSAGGRPTPADLLTEDGSQP